MKIDCSFENVLVMGISASIILGVLYMVYKTGEFAQFFAVMCAYLAVPALGVLIIKAINVLSPSGESKRGI